MMPFSWRNWLRSPLRRFLLLACAALLLIKLSIRDAYTKNIRISPWPAPNPTKDLRTYETLPITGFVNSHIPDGPDCEQLRLPGVLNISKSIDIDDDLLDIAESVVHPLIDYSGQKKDQSISSMVSKTWGRMAGSSVWLEKYGVYLTISRVYFYDKGVREWAIISFIRAQIHDANWNHLQGFQLQWSGENITFPCTFDIPTPYEIGGGFYGPEDPRIAIEQGVLDAEPVVIFNMIEDTKTVRRSMHMYRPFSNFTTKLYIEHEQPQQSEKNWSPFYLPANATTTQQYPSQYVHFVYDYHPLKILRCHALNGACSWAYKQDFPAKYHEAHKHNETNGVMRGGTNFVPINVPQRPGLQSFVGFPRTHTDAGCGLRSLYRPELMVLTTNSTHFWVDYASEALSFGHSLLTQPEIDDACESGRILLANSIARFDDAQNRDETTVSFTVADSTVQVATIKGVRRLVQELPQFQPSSWKSTDAQWNLNITHDVMICSIQSATDYALINTTPVQLEERRKKEEGDKAKQEKADEEKKQQEEDKRKEAERQKEQDIKLQNLQNEATVNSDKKESMQNTTHSNTVRNSDDVGHKDE